MGKVIEKKPAAHWLDVAVKYEAANEPKKADMALKAAIRIDGEEHASNPSTASLPRS